ncbi:MAG: TIGR04086 family membrane protein [Lachnospiraceae bacterium]|nr:TIGR04086 family membrane protein [Lachnospiraceae bacterium]MCD8362549.1 TIGR04086 family membrane protein [Lachnospiraceae bacterium]
MKHSAQYISRALRIVKALLAAYVMTALLLFLTALLLYRFQLDEGKVQIAIIFTYILSCFAGGFLAGKMMQSRKFLWGVLLGLLYFAILTLVSLAVNRETGSSGSGLVTTFLLCMGGGMLGGMLS